MTTPTWTGPVGHPTATRALRSFTANRERPWRSGGGQRRPLLDRDLLHLKVERIECVPDVLRLEILDPLVQAPDVGHARGQQWQALLRDDVLHLVDDLLHVGVGLL